MTKSATLQERKVLRYIPSASSGNTLAIYELANVLGAFDRATRIVLAHLHRKQFIATDDLAFSDRSILCFRTEAGDSIISRIIRHRC